MPSLDALIRSAPGHLRLAAPAGASARARQVAGVWPADPHDPCDPVGTPARDRGWRDVLAVLAAEPATPAQCEALVRALAEAGATALAIPAPPPEPAAEPRVPAQRPAALPELRPGGDRTGPGSRVPAQAPGPAPTVPRAPASAPEPGTAPAALLDAAHRHRLPLVLAAPGHCTVAHLAQLLADLDTAAAHHLQELLETVRGLANDSAAGVLRWLACRVEGQAVLLAPHRPAPPLPAGLTLPADRLAAITEGTTQAATADAGEWNVRLYALGPAPAPYHVLAVARARTAGWPQHATEAVAHAELLLSSWLRTRRAAERERAPIRTSVLQMLMSGNVLAARRAATPLNMSPGVLTADEARIYVIGGHSGYRDTLVSACHHHLGDAALVVGCPVDDEQVIIVATPEAHLADRIRALVTERDGFHLGASRPMPLGALATGHGEATRALAAARSSPERYAVFTPDVDLVRLLPERAARRWAAHLLAPLAGWPAARRTEWLDGMRLWLSYGPIGAARLAGFHRNTVRQRADTLAQALGLDLGAVAGRIRLDLALRVEALYEDAPPLPAPAPGEPDDPAPALDLHDLLSGEQTQAWAADYLAALDADLLPTVAAWITSGQHTPTAAARLGVHPKTVAARLRRAESQLHKPLISHPTPGRTPESANGVCDAHDLILAACLTGLTPRP